MLVTRTYLELTDAAQLRAARRTDDATLRVDRVEQCPPSFYRYLYGAVGERYHWRDRTAWPDDLIRAHLDDAAIALWVLYDAGAPAGYFELKRHDDDGSTEIAYFGLLPERIGRGLGKHLLTEAVERAWATGASRVWLHTCTLDNAAALPNYLARGFRPYREEQYEVALDRTSAAG